MNHSSKYAAHCIAWALLLPLSAAHAGRPLAVDDANVNEKGAGHVEVWVAGEGGKMDTWTVAPAFAPVDDVELGVSYEKARKNGPVVQAIQAKWRITPSQEKGCNVASTLGVAHENGKGSSPYIVGIMTCNTALGAVHLNLTRHNPKSDPAYTSWGVAFERPVGAITPHIEVFGDDTGKPTLQIGAKTDVTDGIQLDATVGRNYDRSATVFSLGFKIAF